MVYIMLPNSKKGDNIMQRINLYRFIKDRLVLIDCGVRSRIDLYIKQRYIVIIEFRTYKYKRKEAAYETIM